MSLNSQRLVAVLSLTFLAGGTAGYLAGHRTPREVAAGNGQAPDGGLPSTALQHHREPERDEIERTTEATLANADLAGQILAAARGRDPFRRRHDIFAIGQQLDRDTIRAVMDATQQLSKSERENAQYPLLGRWLDLDPAAAYEWVRALPRQGQRSALLREFFYSLGLKDPATALTFLTEYNTDPNRGEDFTSRVFDAWSAHDPAAAVDAALNIQKKDSRSSALYVALGGWAKRDPQGALARVAQFPDAEMRRGLLCDVLREWAEEDPQAAANHALSLPAGQDRNDALAGVVSRAAANDHEAAMRLIEQLPAGAARTRALALIVSELGYKEPKVAAEFALALPPSWQRSSIHQVTYNLARQDRATALEWAGRLTSADARAYAIQQIVQEWSSDDPKAAAEYCASNLVGTSQTLGDAVASWARNDVREALAWAGALPDGAQRDAALGSALAVLGGSDPHQAATLATTLLSGQKQTQALGSIAEAWAAKDPGAAAAWAGQLTDASARMSAVSNIASVWAQADPAAAAAWALQSTNNQALSTAASYWAAQDFAAAAKWLDTLPSGNTRDSAVAGFSQTIADSDPESAAAWAVTISTPQQRDNAIGQVFRQWKRADPKSAEAWLRATPALSEEARGRLLQQKN